ncbi:MAG TPA: hypothetical protein DIW64_18840 [Cellvibrio sp.]|nr:hypothetical protein [Cellvibrio sp.]
MSRNKNRTAVISSEAHYVLRRVAVEIDSNINSVIDQLFFDKEKREALLALIDSIVVSKSQIEEANNECS